MKVVVLAAGFATRLYPLTRERAKPLLAVGGRAVLSRILERALAVPGVDGCVVVTNHRFHGQFEEWRAGFPAAVPIRLEDDGATTNAGRRGGIADLALGLAAVHDAAPAGSPPDDVLVVAGDILVEEDLAPHAAFQRAHGAPLVLCRRVPGGMPPGRHGEVVLDDAGRVVRFREKPADPESDLAATCFYFLPADVRADLERYLAAGGDPDAPGHFLAWLVPRRTVLGRVLTGPTFDIGDRESLERARRAYASGELGS